MAAGYYRAYRDGVVWIILLLSLLSSSVENFNNQKLFGHFTPAMRKATDTPSRNVREVAVRARRCEAERDEYLFLFVSQFLCK
jgi:hypothetical protein